jgi:hypothetical protein
MTWPPDIHGDVETEVDYLRGVTIDDLPTSGLWSAHRGSSAAASAAVLPVAPEASMSGYELAYGLGADILDIDCGLTYDGVPVAMHDTTVDRTTNGTGAIASFPSHLLPSVDVSELVGDGWAAEAVPTIEQILHRFGRRVVITIEAKTLGAVAPLGALINSLGLRDSVFLNATVGDSTTIAAIQATGCRMHIFGCTTSGNIATADAAGAWLIELPYNCAPSLITAADAATNIQRWIAAPISRRTERDAMTAGLHGYVSDAPGYLDRTDNRSDIALELARHRNGAGWWAPNFSASAAWPIFSSSGLVVSKEAVSAACRSYRLGTICGPKAGTYSLTVVLNFGAFVGDTSTRPSFRVCCPSEEGTNNDADTRGYIFAVRKFGQLVIWEAPAGYGAATQLGTASSTAIGDGGGDVTMKFDVTPTTVKLTRVDTGTVLGPFTTSAWRGDYIWVSGLNYGGAGPHDATLKSAVIA